MGKLLCFYIGKHGQKKAEKSQKIVQSNRRVSLCSQTLPRILVSATTLNVYY